MTSDVEVLEQASYLCLLFCIFGLVELNKYFQMALLVSYDINYLKWFFWAQGVIYPILIVFSTFGILRQIDGNSTALLLDYLIINTLLYIFQCVLICRHKEDDHKSITQDEEIKLLRREEDQ